MPSMEKGTDEVESVGVDVDDDDADDVEEGSGPDDVGRRGRVPNLDTKYDQTSTGTIWYDASVAVIT